MREQAIKPSKAQVNSEQVEERRCSPSLVDKIHQRMRAKLDELRTDFGKLKDDLHDADQSSARAAKDRIEGLKRAVKEILDAADRAEREWH